MHLLQVVTKYESICKKSQRVWVRFCILIFLEIMQIAHLKVE